ncbi:MAG: PAC2 family protein [Thaumarchaeota archaeon]|jgi:predicted ATP-grasp superfamily ATP-dependent carboligase|nr:PAC2 family protein [Candidatus Geocrenenecus arthurdayi]MCL7389535.1 PAC2 family protein [Candidatus Geocrenenecus arthurdayi]MCL7391759.1 PAC2 family protein [Candidatus Geocrenenecus arthurdayi]MCL7397144.1 PAC2 family protein [Candidatus Geocrenenecus arthurdayi]MCL7401443.1 PAC2 family protein [Candidatus Geocrenenecus arthurdayi]
MVRQTNRWKFTELEDAKIILNDEGERADLRGSSLLESSPSPGAAGYIALTHLIEFLHPVKIGEVKSPHFPQVSIVNDEGLASQPKIELYFYDKDIKLVIMLRNFPIESSEGSYLVAKKLYEFFKARGIKAYYLLSSSRIFGESNVYIASTSMDNAKSLLEAGARLSPNLDTLPIDRFGAYMLSFFARNGDLTFLLISEVYSYLPDPAAAKRLLEVLSRALKFKIDMEKLDIEIQKQKKLIEEFQKGFGQILPERGEQPSREPYYIG